VMMSVCLRNTCMSEVTSPAYHVAELYYYIILRYIILYCIISYILYYIILYYIILFLTAVGFSPGGSTLTLVQTPQYNNTYINGTAQLQYTYWQFTHTIQYSYPKYSILTRVQYAHSITVCPHSTIYPH
jgi:hypothetical protein